MTTKSSPPRMAPAWLAAFLALAQLSCAALRAADKEVRVPKAGDPAITLQVPDSYDVDPGNDGGVLIGDKTGAAFMISIAPPETFGSFAPDDLYKLLSTWVGGYKSSGKTEKVKIAGIDCTVYFGTQHATEWYIHGQEKPVAIDLDVKMIFVKLDARHILMITEDLPLNTDAKEKSAFEAMESSIKPAAPSKE
jgi:hypothetical protein